MHTRKPGKLFILYGPSAAGKTTLLNELLKKLPATMLASVITYTSRAPRANEVNGKDYCFISPEDFLEKLKAGFFIHATRYLDNRYGCSKIILQELKEGKNFIAIFDRAGAQEVKSSIPNVVLIWVTAPFDQLEKRLTLRCENSPEQCKIRLERARQDIAIESADKLYDYVIINTDFKMALQELESIVEKELLNFI